MIPNSLAIVAISFLGVSNLALISSLSWVIYTLNKKGSDPMSAFPVLLGGPGGMGGMPPKPEPKKEGAGDDAGNGQYL
jgi:hypothetical protein